MVVKKCYSGELSHTKKSIFGLRMSSQILYLLFALSFIASVSAAETNCSAVRDVFNRKGFKNLDLQKEPNSDAGGLCLNRGCCSKKDSDYFIENAETQLQQLLKNELEKLASTLASRARRVDDFFRKLLDSSRHSFHNMFKRTYGMIYEQHSYIFIDFFDQLEKYYNKGDTNFEQMMDKFFTILYEKLFAVINSQYNLDERYMRCVNSNMRDIQPFEDVPHKLSLQLRRALVATRTFHKSLRAGADVVRNMVKVGVSNECVTAWARLSYCGTCGGLPHPACSRYCHNVIRGCLPVHADLNEQWDAYVDAVDKVGDRLLGPFNIAMVVEPIDIKISEAIMSFQEHNQDISKKIFTICGQPTLGSGDSIRHIQPPARRRRFVRSIPDFDWNPKTSDVDDFEIEASFESIINEDPSLLGLKTPEGIRKATKKMAEQAKSRERFLQYMKGNINLDEYEENEERDRKKREADPKSAGSMPLEYDEYDDIYSTNAVYTKKPAAKVDEGTEAEWGAPALEKLVRDTRSRLRSSRHYWLHLPAMLCTHPSITTTPCFNGSHATSYTRSLAGEGSEALASNPEVRGEVSAKSAELMRSQHSSLKFLTGQLKDAYNGVEVQWVGEDKPQSVDPDRQDLDSGSGSGSGDDGTDDTEIIEDDDDYPDAGSGERPPEEPTVIDDNERRVPVSEPPFIPNVIDGPGTNNVNIRGRNEESPPKPDGEPDRTPPVDPVADSADRPSLQKALFTYALPVVCAWFGTIVTDLF
ncbi:glypican-1 [Achroia grisella]|uniref:glypican-1 n=1 Tax=Achroia grisella TaxID=688607 RepID=UPI0027D25A9C|nr:glypican-1 [Achroia grisella]